MVRELKEQVLFFLKSKYFMASLLMAALFGYGYELGHSTLGVDDACIELYFGESLGLAIGRWPFYLINRVFQVAEYTPVYLDLLAVLFLMAAAILWCGLIRYIVKKELPMTAYVVFAAMFLDYSLIAEVFIFILQNGVPIIYCLIAAALFFLYYLLTQEMDKKVWISSVFCISLMVSVAIGFYESAAALFLFGVFFILLVDMFSENELKADKMKRAVSILFLAARILVYAIVERSLINRICMLIFNVDAYGYRSVSDSLWILETPGKIINIVLELIRDYIAVAHVFYPIKVFLIAAILFWVILIVTGIRKKRYMMLLMGVGMFVSMFIISIFQGEGLPYRAAQSLNVFVAGTLFVVMVLLLRIKNPFRYVGIVLVFSLIYNSAFELTRWFKLDYEKNQIELQALYQVIEDLEDMDYEPYGDIGKPVVFIGEFQFNDRLVNQYSIITGQKWYPIVRKINDYLEIPPYYRYPFVQTLGNSLINWGMIGMSEYESYNSMMYWIFRELGYNITVGTNEMYQEAMQYLYEMPDFPEEGYMKEFEEYVLVKF